MKKLLGFALVFLLLIAIGLYLTMQYFLGSIVKTGVNKFGPQITQTKVELQGANVSPLSGEGSLHGLSVGNPAGWSAADAFRLGKVHISMEPFSVFKDHIVINELVIEQPEFLYETKLVASNIGDLLKNIEQTLGKKDAEPKTKEGKPIKMEIKKLVLKEGKVTVGIGTTAMALPMPQIDMANIGTAEGGITPPQVAVAIMRNVTTTVVNAAAGALAQGNVSGAATMEAAKQVGQAIKGIFGGAKKPAEPPPPEKK
ncbi:MAG: hypothetical protein Q7S40_29595 [Opitutaceae bacterium]|nr:hypothetical protein [Opitutaceae bacterium]